MKIDIAVTGLIASESPGPGAGIIRAIREHPGFEGRIIGLAYDAKESAIYLPGLCDRVYLIPYPSAGQESLFERLQQIIGKCPIDLMIPSLDSELDSFIRLAPRLEKLGVRMFLPGLEMLEARSKKHLAEVCAKARIGYPRTVEVNSFDKLRTGAESLGFPVYVKGIFYEAELARTPAELEKSAEGIFSRWGFPILLQEVVAGEEFDIALVGDGEGGILGLTAMRKMQLSSKNKAWGGMTVESTDLLKVVRKIVQTLAWRGPMEAEIMRRAGDGKFFLIELNPRFPAWIYFSHGAGCNLPGLMLDHLYGSGEAASGGAKRAGGGRRPPGGRGKAFPRPRSTRVAEPGCLFLRVATDVICPLEEYESLLTRGELVRR